MTTMNKPVVIKLIDTKQTSDMQHKDCGHGAKNDSIIHNIKAQSSDKNLVLKFEETLPANDYQPVEETLPVNGNQPNKCIHTLRFQNTPANKVFICSLCDHATNSAQKGNLMRHIKLKHNMVKVFRCKVCRFETSTRDNLVQHVEATHDKPKPYQCKNCSYASAHKPTLTKHMATVHANNKNYLCEKCDFQTAYKNSLKMHMKAKHNLIKDFSCKECSYTTSLSTSLSAHVKVRHGNAKDRNVKNAAMWHLKIKPFYFILKQNIPISKICDVKNVPMQPCTKVH